MEQLRTLWERFGGYKQAGRAIDISEGFVRQTLKRFPSNS